MRTGKFHTRESRAIIRERERESKLKINELRGFAGLIDFNFIKINFITLTDSAVLNCSFVLIEIFMTIMFSVFQKYQKTFRPDSIENLNYLPLKPYQYFLLFWSDSSSSRAFNSGGGEKTTETFFDILQKFYNLIFLS